MAAAPASKADAVTCRTTDAGSLLVSFHVALARETLTNLRNTLGNLIAGMHPFKVYQIPPHLRASTSAEDWRKVRVRSGRALGVDIEKDNGIASK